MIDDDTAALEQARARREQAREALVKAREMLTWTTKRVREAESVEVWTSARVDMLDTLSHDQHVARMDRDRAIRDLSGACSDLLIAHHVKAYAESDS